MIGEEEDEEEEEAASSKDSGGFLFRIEWELNRKVLEKEAGGIQRGFWNISIKSLKEK